MITGLVTTSAIGIVLALVILHKMRRNQLNGPFALWWLMVAGLAIVVPWFPHFLNHVAHYLGIAYPPALFLLLAIVLILVKMLSMDLQRTRQDKKIRRLTQRLAILEHDIRQLQKGDGPSVSHAEKNSPVSATKETSPMDDRG